VNAVSSGTQDVRRVAGTKPCNRNVAFVPFNLISRLQPDYVLHELVSFLCDDKTVLTSRT